MVNSNYSTDIRLLLPEVIWLEPEHFEQATEISSQVKSEALRWSTYLNALALLGFEEWLQEKTAQPVHREANAVESMSQLKNLPEEAPAAVLSQLKVGEFRYGLMATECLLDEMVSIPQAAIDRPELAAHFYVVLEVDEEQAQVIVRGFLRYDEVNYHSSNFLLQNGGYQLPLSLFDPEPNHLLFYSHYLDASAIPLPEPAQASFLETLQSTRTKLSQWLQGILDEGWLTVDTLLSPEANLAWSTRNASEEVKGGKLINLGMQFGAQTVALLVTVMPEESEKVGILIQLYPTGGERALPPNLQLTLLSKAGKTLQSTQSRSQDNYIQLKPFKGKQGNRFSVEVSIGDVSVSEEFEL